METLHSISSLWNREMSFITKIDEHEIIVDASTENGGNNLGPSPKKLMLVALAGCTGMDVVSLLKKMRVKFEKIEIEVQGNVRNENPKYYTRIHVIYKITGENLDLTKIQKAVKMSEETYCGVGALYRKAIEVTSEIRTFASEK